MINSTTLDKIARDPNQHIFFVMACDHQDLQCSVNLQKVAQIAYTIWYNNDGYRGLPIAKMYYMNTVKNQVFLKHSLQKHLIDDFKVGIYFKGIDEILRPVQWYGNNSLDGLIKFQTMEIIKLVGMINFIYSKDFKQLAHWFAY